MKVFASSSSNASVNDTAELTELLLPLRRTKGVDVDFSARSVSSPLFVSTFKLLFCFLLALNLDERFQLTPHLG